MSIVRRALSYAGVGLAGEDSLCCESYPSTADERVAELEQLLREANQRIEALSQKPSTAEASTQTESFGSGSQPSESSVLSRSEDDLVWMRGPVWNPSKTRCVVCRGKGHTVLLCLHALENRVEMAHKHCSRGWHVPYLHGVWRCQYCGEHLQSKEVRHQQPELYWAQAELEWKKVQRYGSPHE